jgi:hypothetical protein
MMSAPDRVEDSTRKGSGRRYAQGLFIRAMFEPELPGIPPPPEAPWYERLRSRLFGHWKWPGWLAFLYLVVTEIPDWRHRIEFWLGTAEAMGGYLGTAAAVVGSTYFRWALLIGTAGYLLFFGEPKRGVQRHYWWPYVGWSVFGLCLTTILVTIGWGGLQVYIQKEVGKRDQEIQNRSLGKPVFWHLTDYNRGASAYELDQVPEDERFEINVKCLPDSISRTFVEDFGKIFTDHNWKIKANCLFSDVRPDFMGLSIGISDENANGSGLKADKIPENAQKLSKIFVGAQIPFYWSLGKLKRDEFCLIVGNGPNP